MSLKKRLRDFTSQVRSVVSSFLADEEKVHFKPSIKRVSRLQELGFQNHMPAMFPPRGYASHGGSDGESTPLSYWPFHYAAKRAAFERVASP